MLWHAQTMLEMSCFSQKIFFTDLTSSRFHETVNPRNVLKHRNFLVPHTQGTPASGFTKLVWPVSQLWTAYCHIVRRLINNRCFSRIARPIRMRRTTFSRTKRPSGQGTS